MYYASVYITHGDNPKPVYMCKVISIAKQNNNYVCLCIGASYCNNCHHAHCIDNLHGKVHTVQHKINSHIRSYCTYMARTTELGCTRCRV